MAYEVLDAPGWRSSSMFANAEQTWQWFHVFGSVGCRLTTKRLGRCTLHSHTHDSRRRRRYVVWCRDELKARVTSSRVEPNIWAIRCIIYASRRMALRYYSRICVVHTLVPNVRLYGCAVASTKHAHFLLWATANSTPDALRPAYSRHSNTNEFRAYVSAHVLFVHLPSTSGRGKLTSICACTLLRGCKL